MDARRVARLAGWLLPLLAATWVFGGAVASERALSDDGAYACAAQAVSRGASPYVCPRYLYPPLLAQLEAAAVHALPEPLVQSGVRASSLVAGVWLVVQAVSLLALPPWWTAALSSVLVVWSPNLRDALFTGNISPLVCALLLWGMTRWPTRPAAAGLVLAVSLALKPVGLAAWLLLACHRAEPGLRRSQLTAAGVAVLAVVGLSLPGLALLPQMLARASDHPAALHNLSLQRIAHELGVALAPQWQLGGACALMLAHVRLASRSAAELLHLSSAAVLLSAPIVWSHSMLVIYPSLAAVVAQALAAPTRRTEQRRLRLLGVVLGCLCTFECEMFGDAAQLAGRPLAALLSAVPLALALSFAYRAARHASAAMIRSRATPRRAARSWAWARRLRSRRSRARVS